LAKKKSCKIEIAKKLLKIFFYIFGASKEKKRSNIKKNSTKYNHQMNLSEFVRFEPTNIEIQHFHQTLQYISYENYSHKTFKIFDFFETLQILLVLMQTNIKIIWWLCTKTHSKFGHFHQVLIEFFKIQIPRKLVKFPKQNFRLKILFVEQFKISKNLKKKTTDFYEIVCWYFWRILKRFLVFINFSINHRRFNSKIYLNFTKC
jgi:hypothetical protein